jgi:MinD superfamily P-loop ATPase
VLNLIPEFILRHVRDLVSLRPRVIRARCTRCGECVEICPAGAVTLSEKHAAIDDRACIRCLCCQEICPNAAILPRRSLAGKVIRGAGRIVFRR